MVPNARNQTPYHTRPVLSSFAKITYEYHTIVRRHQSCFGEGQKIQGHCEKRITIRIFRNVSVIKFKMLL